jgi:hypothetical protein
MDELHQILRYVDHGKLIGDVLIKLAKCWQSIDYDKTSGRGLNECR